MSPREVLVFPVPDEWVQLPRPADSSQTSSFAVKAKIPGQFLLQVTRVALASPSAAAPTAASVRESVVRAVASVSADAVEKELAVIDLAVPGAAGYYFFATDKAPQPGGYRYLMQGQWAMGDSLLGFTALFNDAPDFWSAAALQTLRGVRREADNQGGAHAVPQDHLVVSRTADGYQLSVPVSRLQLTIPGKQLELRSKPGGAGNPRYFMFGDDKRRMLLSGWFEPAHRFKGLSGFWEDEMAQWAKQERFPAFTNVEMTTVGGWQVVCYDAPLSDSHSTHVRAHWVQAGSWIDVHLSLTGDPAQGATRAALLNILKSLTVAELGGG